MISMVLTTGLLCLGLLLCVKSASMVEQALGRLDRLDLASVDRHTSELTNATDELAQAVDLQG